MRAALSQLSARARRTRTLPAYFVAAKPYGNGEIALFVAKYLDYVEAPSCRISTTCIGV